MVASWAVAARKGYRFTTRNAIDADIGETAENQTDYSAVYHQHPRVKKQGDDD